MDLTPRIYVACLESSEQGEELYGEWVEANQDSASIQADIMGMLRRSPIDNAQRWAIHDQEEFGGVQLDEDEPLEMVAELGQAIAQQGEAFAIHANRVGKETATVEGFQAAFVGEYRDQEDFARTYWVEVMEIPDAVVIYVNWLRVVSDLFVCDFWSEEGGGGRTFVFRS